MRGDGPKFANLLNGRLSPEFVQALEEGFTERSRGVVYTNAELNLKGINSSGSFTSAVFIPGKGWKYSTYNSYNDYIKTFSRTPVYGRNQLSDGTYVYTANPNLPFNYDELKVETAFDISSNNKTTKTETPDTPDFKPGADLFDSLMNMSIRPVVKVQEIGSAPDNSRDLSMETLREIYNFTPEVQRNGKTVLEIFEELSERGHTFIPAGYNPFSRCL